MSTDEMICPSCQSPLISEAVKKGKCQCCGHEFDPQPATQTDSDTQTQSTSS